MVRKYGGVRATQAVLLAAAGMLALAALGSGVTGLALAAVVLGLGYGAAAPASTHLLVPQTPQPVFNLVMSLRQIGVPFGGVLAALILPPLAFAIGWRGALLTELGPVLLLMLLMEMPRQRWDTDRDPAAASSAAPCWQPFALLRESALPPPVRRRFRLCRPVAVPGRLHDRATDHRRRPDPGRGRPDPRRLPDRRFGQPPDLGLDRRPLPDPGPDPGGARRRHGRCFGAHRLLRPRLANLGDHGERAARGLHGRRLHRRRLRRIRRPRRHTAHRGYRSGHRHLVRRRHGGARRFSAPQ